MLPLSVNSSIQIASFFSLAYREMLVTEDENKVKKVKYLQSILDP